MIKRSNNYVLQAFFKQAANLEDIAETVGETISPVSDKLGMDNLSDSQKGLAAAALLAAPAIGAVTSNRGAANGALQGAITSTGALAGYNAGRLAGEQLDKANMDKYIGSGGLTALKALAMLGGTAAGGYAGHKAGERLWLG